MTVDNKVTSEQEHQDRGGWRTRGGGKVVGVMSCHPCPEAPGLESRKRSLIIY